MAANPGKEKARFPFTHKRGLITKSAQALLQNVRGKKKGLRNVPAPTTMHFSKLLALIRAFLSHCALKCFTQSRSSWRSQKTNGTDLLFFKQVMQNCSACPIFTAWPALVSRSLSPSSLSNSTACTSLRMLQCYRACF